MLHHLDFSDRTILVTGGTSGIGESVVKALAAAGAQVVFTGRRQDLGEALAAAVPGSRYVAGDVTDDAHLAAAVAAAQALGGLHGAFNNAGIEGDPFRPSHEQSHDNYRTVFDINVWGVLSSMKHEVPALLASGGGAIVNNSSIAGLIGFPGMAVYTASKHAVSGLTRAAALEYAKNGVRVNAVAPGPIETDMYGRFAPDDATKDMINNLVPMGRPGTVDEIASAVLYLLHPASSYVNGQILAIDGAFTSA